MRGASRGRGARLNVPPGALLVTSPHARFLRRIALIIRAGAKGWCGARKSAFVRLHVREKSARACVVRPPVFRRTPRPRRNPASSRGQNAHLSGCTFGKSRRGHALCGPPFFVAPRAPGARVAGIVLASGRPIGAAVGDFSAQSRRKVGREPMRAPRNPRFPPSVIGCISVVNNQCEAARKGARRAFRAQRRGCRGRGRRAA